MSEKDVTASATTTSVVTKGKRRRTRSHNSSPSPGRGFFVPGFENGSSGGHKMMSLSELMDATKGITNMYLAHEIAVDKNFTLKKLQQEDRDDDEQPPQTIEAQIRRIVHRAFWDILEKELKEDPPVYNQALSLLEEVREGLVRMLLPNQHRLKQLIMEKIDIELIKQQVENEALDFTAYANYILDMMSKLCAPARDEEMKVLKEMDKKDVVKVFQGILKTLEDMRLDMANFLIQQARPLIVSQSVEYEKLKFKEFLATQTDGLEFTRAWLMRHSPTEEEEESLRTKVASRTIGIKFKKLLMNRIITDAFIELLEWDDYHPLPETLVMDQKRMIALRDQTERTSVSTAIILVAFSNVSGFVVPADSQKLKSTVKMHVDILLEEFYDDSDLLRILPNVALQVVKDVNAYLAENGKQPLPDSSVKNLQEQISEMEDPNQRIRDLVQRRILDFNRQAISVSPAAPLQIPPGLTLCQKELAQIAGSFTRLVSYNRSVFCEFYEDIVENHVLFRKADKGTSSGKQVSEMKTVLQERES